MSNFEKFCEEVFYESSKEHLIEVTIERLMRALQHDVGDAVNAGARETFWLTINVGWKQALNGMEKGSRVAQE